MKIAYRRMSGAMPLSADEKGSRGLWWEKRWGLIRALRSRGHQIEFVTRMSKASRAQWSQASLKASHELLIVEFGSSNKQFYGADLQQTLIMLAKHKGKVIFLCDDPDLPFIWRDGAALDYDQWICWYNATRRPQLPGQPERIPVRDFPFAALVRGKPITPHTDPRLIYFGRPNGRQAAIRQLLAAKVSLVVAGKPKEWAEFPEIEVIAPPDQPRRAQFYRQFRAALVLADAKHKRMGWRTGRAYHALAAGVPVFTEPDHPAMPSGSAYANPEDLKHRLALLADEAVRRDVWAGQFLEAQEDRELCDQAFEEAGL